MAFGAFHMKWITGATTENKANCIEKMHIFHYLIVIIYQ